MAFNDLLVLILAAGKGTRMVSDLPKVCHTLGGRAMLTYVLEAAQKLNPQKIITVVSPEMPQVERLIEDFQAHSGRVIEKAIQPTQQGTGHAVMAATQHLKGFMGDILVLFGDTPLLTVPSLQKLVRARTMNPSPTIVLMGIRPQDKLKYGRIFLKENGDVASIVEHADATLEQLMNPLCNSGVMLIDGKRAVELLAQVKCHNANGEYYLTDIVFIANQQGFRVAWVEAETAELSGINTRQDLAAAEAILQKRWREKAMAEGVTLIDPSSVFFSYDTKVGQDVTIAPYVVFGPHVTLQNHVTIHSFCHIEGTCIAEHTRIGPFAHLRPGSTIGQKVRIGNFVEVKQSNIGEGAKINHLSYIGDCDLGSYTNIGAGTITCNYDGFHKHKTLIGEHVSIGANTSLIAPIEIGDRAVIGAGSVIVHKVLADSLTYSRAPQQDIVEGAKRYRHKKSKLSTG